MRTLFFTAIILSLLFACAPEVVYNEADLLGTWHCYQWDNNGDMKDIAKGNVNFSFENDIYVYQGGEHKEKGTWKIKGLHLVTQVEGLMAKEVEITRLSQDTLVIDMVDNGIPMTMYLFQE